jgi:uncharacterized protein
VNRPLACLRQFVLKVHSRCDLACDHSNVYASPGRIWRGRSLAISEQAPLSRTPEQIAGCAASHRLRTVQVVLHGGEPLLAWSSYGWATELRSALSAIRRLDLWIPTNGVLPDEYLES